MNTTIILILFAVVLGHFFFDILGIKYIKRKRKEKKVIQQCITAYEGVIKELPNHKDWLEFLRKYGMEYGLCRYLIKNNLKEDKWIDKISRTWGH